MAYQHQYQSYTAAILNLYLYGQEDQPDDFFSNELIRDEDSANWEATYEMDVNEYMNGAGRFANGAQNNLVTAFFDSSIVIPEGTYTKKDLGDLLGFSGYATALQAYEWGDGVNDLVERALIFNSQSFQISASAEFHVTATGERYITNFAMEPDERPASRENFDFVSGDPFAQLINDVGLERWIDPFLIGNKVWIDFKGVRC